VFRPDCFREAGRNQLRILGFSVLATLISAIYELCMETNFTKLAINENKLNDYITTLHKVKRSLIFPYSDNLQSDT